MSDNEPMFSDPVKSLQILTLLTQGHEVIVEAITDMMKSSIIPLAHVLSDVMWKVNDLSIPERMVNNIAKANEQRATLANLMANGNIERKHYDLYVMELTDLIRDMVAIGMIQTDLLFDDFGIELSNTVENVEETGEEFRSLLSQALVQAVDLSIAFAQL